MKRLLLVALGCLLLIGCEAGNYSGKKAHIHMVVKSRETGAVYNVTLTQPITNGNVFKYEGEDSNLDFDLVTKDN